MDDIGKEVGVPYILYTSAYIANLRFQGSGHCLQIKSLKYYCGVSESPVGKFPSSFSITSLLVLSHRFIIISLTILNHGQEMRVKH